MEILKDKNITDFLDAVDEVLNSQTFLGHFSIALNESIETALRNFIASNELKKQILEQDLLKFGNYKRQEGKLGTLGNLHKSSFEIYLKLIKKENSFDYLKALLTTKTDLFFLQSPYNKELSELRVEKILRRFIETLLDESDWDLYSLNTSFLYNKEEERSLRREGKYIISYFYNLFGDTASLVIVENNQAFLLLTNGSD